MIAGFSCWRRSDGIALLVIAVTLALSGVSFTQEIPTAAANAPANPAGGMAEAERVIVTGSNIPSAEEVGL